jgi:BirA family biotin operon repressor/biotin-[acetyl-CoA-carboxylase] ligase
MTWPFVRNLHVYDVLESTSDLARQWVEAGTHALPLAIWAASQTRGRGRGDHRWWSDEGSLTFTIALDPAGHGLNARHEPRLALTMAVAVIDAIAPLRLSPPAGIRWPNDIETGGRKLGGILPERIETPWGHRLLIGVGLNVESRLDRAPAEVGRMAASLGALRHEPALPGEKERLLRSSLARFAIHLERLAADDPALAARWAALDSLRDRVVRVDLGPRIITGRCQGIDEDGALCLAAQNELVRLFGGQVLRDS